MKTQHVLIALGIAAAGGAAWWYFNKQKQVPAVSSVAPTQTPEQIVQQQAVAAANVVPTVEPPKSVRTTLLEKAKALSPWSKVIGNKSVSGLGDAYILN